METLEQLRALQSATNTAFITTGELLYKIRTEKLWQQAYESYDDFLMELRMSKGTASKLAKIYKVFVLDANLPTEEVARASWSTLGAILPHITPSNAAEWLNKAILLSRTDILRELKEQETGIPMTDCKHEKTHTIAICDDCGVKHAVLPL